MKTPPRYLPIASLILPALVALGQEGLPEPQVVDKGPHHRTWERTVTQLLPNGRQVQRKSSYIELACGMHKLVDGVFQESREDIELFEDGAVARNGPHQVIFAPNFNSAGLIDLLTPDGKRFRSHILGLGVYDTATGQSTLIAEPQNSIGELHPPNQIVYRRAFDGLAADVVYRNTKSSFVQDVIVLEQIQLPPGFNPETTRLEVWTEFMEAPSPQKDVQVRSGITDENLDFGAMLIGPGGVLVFGENGATTRGPGTSKRWIISEGRTFLIEAVPFQAIKTELEQLPPQNQQAANRKTKDRQMALAKAGQRAFPAAPPPKAKKDGQKIQVVQAERMLRRRGLVLDYDLSANLTNYTFRSDTTYYVSGPVNLYQTNTAEGGVVIKLSPTNNAQFIVNGQLRLATAPYRPVTLTARDDHSIGTQIGSASLSGYYGSYGVFFNILPDAPWEYLRVFYASNGVGYQELNHTIRHSQFAHCRKGIENVKGQTTTLENVLMYNMGTVCYNASGSASLNLKASHLTLHQCGNFAESLSQNVVVSLTNSILVRMTNWGAATWTTNMVHIGTDSSVFQSVGAAGHYLASSSPYRNIGVIGISSTLSNALRLQTTYPPIVIAAGAYSNSLVLVPQAQRDTDAFDLGAHYPPLDYAFGHVTFNDASITLKPGAVIATYATTTDDYGLYLLTNARLTTEGTPTALARIVRHNTVQELATNSWSARLLNSIGTAFPVPAVAPSVSCRFAFWASPAQDSYHFNGYYATNFPVEFTDCQFFGGLFKTEGPTINVTNCLFSGAGVTVNEYAWNIGPTFLSSTFSKGSLSLLQDPDSGASSTWTLKNNLFDDIVLASTVVSTIVQASNAYTANVTRLTPTDPMGLVLSVTNVTYDVGVLGRYYLPTNLASHSALFNSGTTNANYLGLYHYTCTTNQLKETNSVVDRGFHFVALNSSGQPFDADADGLPDYYENFIGNGLVNSRETSWTNSTDIGLKVVITKPQSGSTIP